MKKLGNYLQAAHHYARRRGANCASGSAICGRSNSKTGPAFSRRRNTPTSASPFSRPLQNSARSVVRNREVFSACT